MTLILVGPKCFVCGGTNVVKRQERGITAWGGRVNFDGSVTADNREGIVFRDVCLDCEKKRDPA